MDRYKAAAEGAKSKGDDRKARMHQRIVKQYQDAIRSHKAGRPVNLADLPVPPGCPPLQGSESSQQNFMGVLETAMKLANQDADAEDEDGTGELAKVTTMTYYTDTDDVMRFLDSQDCSGKWENMDAMSWTRRTGSMFMLTIFNFRSLNSLSRTVGVEGGGREEGGLPVDITKVEAFTPHTVVLQHEEDCGGEGRRREACL
ncbi:uncharacterized protein LOC127922354 [Oncorhynchus keta]|uniref:uncharacterized protein LOC127922354 n=1 Tax=Oncorhynchus keta TaxID=8018 RepID=UPI00227A8467|nr:uncharacterized protein LOC127922354 [Oncorhynchus keta]